MVKVFYIYIYFSFPKNQNIISIFLFPFFLPFVVIPQRDYWQGITDTSFKFSWHDGMQIALSGESNPLKATTRFSSIFLLFVVCIFFFILFIFFFSEDHFSSWRRLNCNRRWVGAHLMSSFSPFFLNNRISIQVLFRGRMCPVKILPGFPCSCECPCDTWPMRCKRG